MTVTASAKTPPSSLPAKIGRYEIRAKLADGGMASIYVGRLSGPAGFEKLQAIKVIKPEFSSDKDFTNMFLDEARIAAKLSHPSIVQVHELGEDEASASGAREADGKKRLFIAMELLFGESLWDVWFTARAKKQKLPDDIVAWIGARTAEGLHHAHELVSGGVKQNVVHRDVNPSNVFITYDGQVKIIDFGLAKAKNRVTETGLGVIKGKVAYMAPEQTKSGRDLDHRADLFALGVTLYELTTDSRLFKRNDNVSTLAAVAECKVPDPTASTPGYSPALWGILKKALAKDRNDRYASGKDMAEALDAFSRSRGRVVTAATVTSFMEELFGPQRERYQKWLDEVRSERPVPSAEESFRGPPTVDENAVIVGANVEEKKPPSKTSTPVTALEGEAPLVDGVDAKRPDPFAPKPAPSAEDVEATRETSRAWLWALLMLAAAGVTAWWASHRM